jgi:tRNA A37 threonylcarbamoyladenosine biosynthesis protein TsaE
VHLDLYRLRGDDELENLGLRDWLAAPGTWTLIEWPERAPRLAGRCDLMLTFAVTASAARRVAVTATTAAGNAALRRLRQGGFNNPV